MLNDFDNQKVLNVLKKISRKHVIDVIIHGSVIEKDCYLGS